ncbi:MULTISPECIES: efflux RND transporter periplasmic adaptor subunit [unclassified Rhizobium]|jgi:multidrug efflux system membrane fusion protein|uniref:efflux RND transporter periplasmic adaptor subunit n=1 Tax=unclassified Rhizobium TaxID=2613769 RepID=UPI0006488E59|nr:MULTISPECIES: efflux RND transporter periplasmic adaptor subunit [unclassified Rhizobium]MBN8951115.1 efflux RND transporter periplasmic adaptor subunit [Rhizobium tropici]OJY69140.1 MAG: efflux transporter periplasmic adaptor subunit [Rhizobium sp. 60-20]RKD73985.1 RND family efflux transporter MFP subunit [Rhizobium sp. WW_1]
MKKFWLPLGLLVVAALAVWGYRDRIPFLSAIVDQASAETKDNTKTPAKGGQKHQALTSVVKTAAVEKRLLPNDITATGSAVAQNATTIAAQESGIITSIEAQDGAMVKAGDLIARLDARTAQAAVDKDQATIAKDQATLVAAESALTRAKSLLANAGTQQTVDQAVAARDTAAADVNADKAQLASDQVLLENTQIRAPYDGRLGNVVPSPGAYVTPGTAIVTITQYNPIYVQFHMQENQLRELEESLKGGTVPVSTVPNSSKGKSRQGAVSFFDNTVDPSSGTILVKAKFDNANGAMWPGRSVNVVVHLTDNDPVIVAPTVAISPGPDGFYAYVVKDNKVHLTPVTVERENGAYTAIAKGLSEGDHVVVEGQVQLIDGQNVVEQFSDEKSENVAAASDQSSQKSETISVGAQQ